MASTPTTRNRLNQQGTGDNVGTWGGVLNSQALSLVDEAMDGITSIAVSGNVTLTSTNYVSDQARRRVLKLTGSPGATFIVTIPSVEKFYVVINSTNAPQTVKAGGLGVTIPAAVMTTVVCDGTDCFAPAQTVTAAIGTVCDFAGTSAPSGWLLCYGQPVSRAAYAALFGVIGTIYGTGDGSTTFNVPDLRGRVLAGADNMGGSASGRLTSFTIGVAGGTQTNALAVTNLPSHSHGVTDPTHSHGTFDPGHAHTYAAARIAGGSSFAGGAALTIANDAAAATGNSFVGITINNASTGILIQNTGSGTPHTVVQPTMALNKIIYAGV
jgi:microcystin-dependent protein